MNRALFLELSSHPNRVEPSHIEGLTELVKSFPYFQAAKVLHCLSLKKGQEIGYVDAIKSAALHTSNRKRLFELLEQRLTDEKIEVLEIKEESGLQKSPIDFQFEAEERIKNVMKQAVPVEEIIRQIVEYPLIIEDSKRQELNQDNELDSEEKRVDTDLPIQKEVHQPIIVSENAKGLASQPAENSFLFWLKKVNDQPSMHKQLEVLPKKEVLPSKSTQELIEMFIKTEPRISSPQKVDFYSPITMSKKSSEDSEEIVSETLAKVYEAQANNEKAIRIYQKLSLLYPDKSSYFAARIKNLEKTDLL